MDILNDKSVRKAVHNSIRWGWHEIEEYVLMAEKPARFIAKYYVKHMFPYYKEHNHPSKILDKSDETLKTFWEAVARISCYDF